MNKRQTQILGITIAIIIALGIFPPWNIISPRSKHLMDTYGHNFILWQPQKFAEIAWSTLLIECAVVVSVAAFTLYLSRTKN